MITVQRHAITLSSLGDFTTSAPLIFDRSLVRRRLARAVAQGFSSVLVDHAALDLRDRLSFVRRRFDCVLDLGTPTDAALQCLRAEGLGQTTCIRSASVKENAQADLAFVGDEEALPLRPQSVDLVISLLSLHSVNDLPGVLSQIRTVLAPDGLFLGCFFGGSTLQELRQSFIEAETELEGGASPRVAPFVDVKDAGALLQRAGFTLPVADVDSLTLHYSDLFALMSDIRAMGMTNALTARRRTPLRRATLMRAAQIYAERYSNPNGRIRATVEIVWLCGWSAHESQQKPLKPGSATMRLSDALAPSKLTPTPVIPKPSNAE